MSAHLNADAWAVLGWLAAVITIITICLTRKHPKGPRK